MMNADLIGVIAIVTLALFILGALGLPFIAAMYHVTYVVDDKLVTGAIAALSGIVSAIVVKKISDNNKPSQ